MELTQERVRSIVEVTVTKLLTKERAGIEALVAAMRGSVDNLYKESMELNRRVEKLLGEPRCPTCGRSNKEE